MAVLPEERSNLVKDTGYSLLFVYMPTNCATRSTLIKHSTSGTKTGRSSVYFCVVFSPDRRVKSKGAESYVAEIRDLILFAVFVLSQTEGPGRALVGRTSGGLHLPHLCGLLS